MSLLGFLPESGFASNFYSDSCSYLFIEVAGHILYTVHRDLMLIMIASRVIWICQHYAGK